MYIYQPIRDGRQYDPNPNPKHYVILSPISDWLIYVHCVPSILGKQYWPPGIYIYECTVSIKFCLFSILFVNKSYISDNYIPIKHVTYNQWKIITKQTSYIVIIYYHYIITIITWNIFVEYLGQIYFELISISF